MKFAFALVAFLFLASSSTAEAGLFFGKCRPHCRSCDSCGPREKKTETTVAREVDKTCEGGNCSRTVTIRRTFIRNR